MNDEVEEYLELGKHQATRFLSQTDRSRSHASCLNAFEELENSYRITKRFRDFLAKNEYPTMTKILIDEVLTEPEPKIKTCNECGHSTSNPMRKRN